MLSPQSRMGLPGVEARIGAVKSRALACQRFFCALVPELRVAGREEPQGSPVLHRSSNSRSVAHPFRSGLAVHIPQLEHLS